MSKALTATVLTIGFILISSAARTQDNIPPSQSIPTEPRPLSNKVQDTGISALEVNKDQLRTSPNRSTQLESVSNSIQLKQRGRGSAQEDPSAIFTDSDSDGFDVTIPLQKF
jgi:hypothetical protein